MKKLLYLFQTYAVFQILPKVFRNFYISGISDRYRNVFTGGNMVLSILAATIRFISVKKQKEYILSVLPYILHGSCGLTDQDQPYAAAVRKIKILLLCFLRSRIKWITVIREGYM